LYGRIAHCDELTADTYAYNGVSERDRTAYGATILDLMSKTHDADRKRLRFEKIRLTGEWKKSRVKKTKERLIHIQHKKQTSRGPKEVAYAILIILFVSVMAFIPTLAYSPPLTEDIQLPYEDDYNIVSMFNPCNYVELFSGQNGKPYKGMHESLFRICDSFITDGNDCVYYFTGARPYTECQHEYSAGIRSRHKLFPDRSCRVYTYTGMYCTLCGKMLHEESASCNTYPKCPHN